MKVLWQEKKEGIVSLLVLVGLALALGLLAGPVLYHADRYRSELRKDAKNLAGAACH